MTMRRAYCAAPLMLSLVACVAAQDAGTSGTQTPQSALTEDPNGSASETPSPTVVLPDNPNTIQPPAAPKTTPTGTTIGTTTPGVSTGYDPNGTVKPPATTQNPNTAAGANPNTKAPVTNPNTATPTTPSIPTSPASPTTPIATPTPTPTPAPAPAPTTSYTPVLWPNIGFNDYSGSLGKKVVALTFDDGPDGTGTGQNNTAGVLDFLKANNIKASFFVCGSVWTTVTQDASAQADMKRIVAEGHDIGSHTYSHPHLDTISAADIQTQFANNLTMARSIFGASFNFSMYRAPFGFPFQANNPNVSWVAPAAAPNGVHVGWGIDTDDWKCAGNGQPATCILDNLKAQLDAGHSGPILMHAVYKLTVDTLPDIVAMLKAYGYTFATAQEMIVDKYGANSADIQTATAAKSFSYSDISTFAVSECKKNQYIQVLY